MITGVAHALGGEWLSLHIFPPESLAVPLLSILGQVTALLTTALHTWELTLDRGLPVFVLILCPGKTARLSGFAAELD